MTQFSEYSMAAQHDGPYIDCRDLFKIYKRADLEVVALRGLDLSVASGELIAVIGASGSGKSTLLNILAGLDRPSAGQVLVGSRDLLDVSDKDLVMYRRSEVGFVWAGHRAESGAVSVGRRQHRAAHGSHWAVGQGAARLG